MRNLPSRVSGRIISGSLLVAGTCIGAGMLAMPIVTAQMGFTPSLILNLICWFLTMCTGLLFLEAMLWLPDESNFFSMAQRFLGTPGKWIITLFYLFLHYSLLVGYFSAAEPLVQSFSQTFLGFFAPNFLAFSLIGGFFFVVIVLGLSFVDRVNSMLMGGLVASYICMITLGSQEVQSSFLSFHNWGLMFLAAPTIMSAFGYHNVIPSICSYLERDVKVLRWTIILGSTLALVIYTLWQWLILGSIEITHLQEAQSAGEAVSQTLMRMETLTGSRWIPRLGVAFSFFALVTSLLGVGFSMVDFLADGTHGSHHGSNRAKLCLYVLLPPLVIAAYWPGIFLDAMAYAGGFGEVTLNAIFPISVVWIGRYCHKLSSKNQLPGGRWTLSALLLLSLAIFYVEILHIWG